MEPEEQGDATANAFEILAVASHSLLSSMAIIKLSIDTAINKNEDFTKDHIVALLELAQPQVDFVADTLMDFAHGLPEEIVREFKEERRKRKGALHLLPHDYPGP